MKIGLVYLGKRGSGPAFSLQLANALAKIVEVKSFISSYIDNLAAWQVGGLEIAALPTFQTPLQAAGCTLFPQRIDMFVDELRAFNPDVLLFCMFHPWNGILQRRFPTIRSVVIVHDPQPHPGLLPRLHRLGEDYSLRKADMAMVLSKSLIPELERRGMPAGRILATRHGLLSPLEEQAAGDLAAIPGKRVLFFGRITQYKGLEILLQSWPGVLAIHPDAQLTIAGNGSLRQYRKWLHALPGIEVINRWVTEDEARMLFRHTSLVAMPYTSASQSGVVPLAAEAGRAVVASRVGGLPEQIADGKSGILISPGDVESLTQAINDVLANPQRARQLGVTFRQDYRKNFSWEQIAADVLNACGKAVEQKRGNA